MEENFFNEAYSDTIEVFLTKDDSIDALADAFDTTPEEIAAANPGVDLTRPAPDQPVQVPFRRCENGTPYTIQRGDTLASIARRFGVTQAAILRENPFLAIFGLRPGLRICIPRPRPQLCLGGFFYTIRPGDTLFSIANRFNTTVGAILRANPGLDPNRLVIGSQICIPGAPPQPACPGGFIYTVVSGDTLFSIATRFNTTVQAILQANPGLNPNLLVAGQRICIPVPRPPACPGFFYTVVPGDNLTQIALRFNTTVQAILAVNPGLNPNFIVPGQQICIPRVQPVPVCTGFFYTIVAGDTLFSIAARFNTSVNAILAANPGLDPNRLVIGQQICIPA